MPDIIELKKGWKKTKLGLIPNDWSVLPIETFVQKKGIIRGPFGGALKKAFFVENGYKVYQQSNAIYNNFEIGSYFIDQNKYAELSRFAVKPGDLIVSCSGTIGKIAEVPETASPGVINQALLILRIGQSANKEFFVHQFNSRRFQNTILDNTQGGAMKNLIGMSEFRKVKMVSPPPPRTNPHCRNPLHLGPGHRKARSLT